MKIKLYNKSYLFPILLLVIFGGNLNQSHAAQKITPKDSFFQNAIKMDESKPSQGKKTFRFGLGYAFFGNYSGGTETSSISTLFSIDDTHAIQLTFGIGQVSDQFNFGTSVNYRATVAGDRFFGLHIGGHLGLGIPQKGDFLTRLGPLVGIHFGIPKAENIQISIDGGGLISINRGVDFQVQTLGSQLGASIHYIF